MTLFSGFSNAHLDFPNWNLTIVLYLSWQLGLVEKNILNYDFDLVASDPSDANTNSTTLFSDDTDDKSKRNTNPETGLSVQQEEEVNVKKRVLK